MKMPINSQPFLYKSATSYTNGIGDPECIKPIRGEYPAYKITDVNIPYNNPLKNVKHLFTGSLLAGCPGV